MTQAVALAQLGNSGLTFRNRIINGDMRIDQRNAGAAVTANNAFPVDRFRVSNSTDGAFSAQQDSSAPTGFVTSLKYTATTADASLGATQYAALRQRIEGTNISDLAWGTASAKTITLSFWVRSSLTGTFGGAVTNASDRSYPFTYTISAADTWEQKSITVAGDTTGTWLTTTGTGIELWWGLGVGSTYSGTAGSWAGAFYISATGATSVIGTLNATWYITGVQLEVGSVATPFERRPYGAELALCQRYYIKFGPYSDFGTMNRLGAGLVLLGTNAGINMSGVPMRSSPTVSYNSGIQLADGSVLPSVTSIAAASSINGNLTAEFVASGGGLTVGRASHIRLASATTDYVAFSAEL